MLSEEDVLAYKLTRFALSLFDETMVGFPQGGMEEKKGWMIG